jgi:hypothetical protein
VKLGRCIEPEGKASLVAVKLLFQHKMTPSLRMQLAKEVQVQAFLLGYSHPQPTCLTAYKACRHANLQALGTVSHEHILQLLDKYDAVNYPNRKALHVKREVRGMRCNITELVDSCSQLRVVCCALTSRSPHLCWSWLLLESYLTSSGTLASWMKTWHAPTLHR